MNTQKVDTAKRPIKSLNQQIMANKEQAIKLVANELFGEGNWSKEGLHGHIYQNGCEVYQFKGIKFIELAAVSFTSTLDGDTFNVSATQSFRRLEPATQ